ncbi:hypothetical protein C0J52_02969 [Blattella germanica]|nr:hypothetical protein C0J52_02969 [Blattella germanica]
MLTEAPGGTCVLCSAADVFSLRGLEIGSIPLLAARIIILVSLASNNVTKNWIHNVVNYICAILSLILTVEYVSSLLEPGSDLDDISARVTRQSPLPITSCSVGLLHLVLHRGMFPSKDCANTSDHTLKSVEESGELYGSGAQSLALCGLLREGLLHLLQMGGNFNSLAYLT